MIRFSHLFRWSWTLLVAVTLTMGLAGCDGKDGATGAQGPAGPEGPEGPAAPVPGDVTAAIESAKVESCATCHAGIGDGHQAIYDKYTDPSTLALTITNVTSLLVAGPPDTYTVTVNFSITKSGAPFTDFTGLDQKRFLTNIYDSATNQYLNGLVTLNESDSSNVVMVADGDYVLTKTGVAFDPTVNGQVYGYVAQGALLEHAGGSGAELPAGTHVHLYDDVASAALAFGDAMVADPDAYVSAANVTGCAKCHGTPYLKHGYRDPVVAGLPDFASCKTCHNDDGPGFHQDWQYMVDEPLNWATGVASTADYSYRRTIMNDTHMSHAMEFPYPQSTANCSTCHEGKLTALLDDSNFTAETCKSCHAVQGIDAWPEYTDAMGVEQDEGKYFQAHRAPAFEYLWTRGANLTFHDNLIGSAAPDACTTCHGAAGVARGLSAIHTGYDPTIYDATGTKYAALNTVSIDQITRSGDLLTINFSSNNTSIVPELLVSFYGWDSKHFLVGSHERDANVAECGGSRPGCKMEYTPESSGGSANPLFTEDPASAPGAWMVTLDTAALQLTKTDDIPTLIADGVIKKVEVAVTPELDIGGVDVVLSAVDETFDLNAGVVVADYFKGANSTVEIDKCNVCHDSLASSFHDGSGRAGDGIEVCKNCHTTTFPGSHVEMASRAIDSYTHAIHSFQDFDVGDTFETFDPVLAKRYDQHIKHVFPNFTIRNCEACHRDGTYNVPDQSKSMPGVLSASDTVATWYGLDAGDLAVEDPSGRNIGMLPEYVTGPASRACGGCHRARLINDDLAGDLASLNAHTESGGTLAENDDDDEVVFGIIDKIMSMFE